MTQVRPWQIVRPWQVWWADLNPVRGHEQSGRRPVVVVSSSLHLRLVRANMITVVPLTTRERPELVHRVRIEIPGKPVSYAITEQIRGISDDRLLDARPIGELTADQIEALRDVLRKMVDF